MKEKMKNLSWFLCGICLLVGCAFLNTLSVQAEESVAGEVAITEVNYSDLTMTINPKGNTIVYYSKDKKTWDELEYYSEYVAGNATGNRVMDISWVSASADTKLYLKGDKNEEVVTVVLPKKNTSLKVTFDKTEGILEFDNYEDATSFEWRKNTDYNWQKVPLNESSAEWIKFIQQLESLRVKGAKIVVRTPAKNGTSADDAGARPSKEVTVSISKRSNAPSVSINIKKFTVSTTTKHEYSINGGVTWFECDKTMSLREMLPQVFAGKGAVSGTLMVRTAATENAGYSKTQTIVVDAQKSAPAASKLSYYFEGTSKKKIVIQFPDATTTNAYEYMIVKPGADFDETKSWKSVTKNKIIKISQSSAPEGSVIYYRYKGTAASKSKGTAAVLPSAYGMLTVKYE